MNINTAIYVRYLNNPDRGGFKRGRYGLQTKSLTNQRVSLKI